jgi:hypothetical protein
MSNNNQTALLIPEPQQAIQPITPLSMIQLALQQGASVEILRDLFQLKKEVEADEARKAYDMAFAAFKSESIRIVKNIEVTAGPLNGKKYADLLAVVEALTGKLSAHGLSSSWKITKDDPQWLEVTCTIRHERGHSESVSMGGPPDAGGAKNAIQARASTVTYLQRYTLLAATGMAAGGTDTDGRAPQKDALPDDKSIPLQEAIKYARDMAELKEAFKKAYKMAVTVEDQKAFSSLYEARKRDLL